MHRFHFIGSYSFCTFRPIQVLDALLNKTCKNHRITLKLSPMNFWLNLHLFEYQKGPNRMINKKVTEFCKLLGGQYFFCNFFSDYFSFPQWHILSWLLVLQLKIVIKTPVWSHPHNTQYTYFFNNLQHFIYTSGNQELRGI